MRPSLCCSFEASNGSESGEDDATSSSSSSETRSLMLPRPSTAKPQVLKGRPVWPEFWGITRDQLRELLEKLRQDPTWSQANNVYTLVDDFIVPWTRGSGLGYALLQNEIEPKEVSVMISHAFVENAEEFLETVLRSTEKHDILYICALANYQAEDCVGPSIEEQLGSSPQESPFRRVLEHIAVRTKEHPFMKSDVRSLATGMMLVSFLLLCMENMRLPGLFLLIMVSVFWLVVTRSHLYDGRMIVVPNLQGDIYMRLWCVYEIFVAKTLGLRVRLAPTLASAGKVHSRDALCSSRSDMERISAEIQASSFGYDRIDTAVKQTLHESRWHGIGLLAKYGIIQLVPWYIKMHLLIPHLPVWRVLPAALCVFCFLLALTNFIYRRKGIINLEGTLGSIIIGCAVGTCVLDLLASRLAQASNVWKTWWALAMDLTLYEAANVAVILLASLSEPFPRFFEAHWRASTLFCLASFSFSLNYFITDLTDDTSADSDTYTRLVFALLQTLNEYTPIYTYWTESVHFGLRTKRTSRGHCMFLAVWASLLIWFTHRRILRVWSYAHYVE